MEKGVPTICCFPSCREALTGLGQCRRVTVHWHAAEAEMHTYVLLRVGGVADKPPGPRTSSLCTSSLGSALSRSTRNPRRKLRKVVTVPLSSTRSA